MKHKKELSISDDEHRKRIKEAIKRVHDFDKIDGWADRECKTICAALAAGLKHPHTGASYDALVMLAESCGFEKILE